MIEFKKQFGVDVSRRALKSVAFALISLLVVVANFWLESAISADSTSVDMENVAVDYKKSNELENGLVLRFSGDDNDFSVFAEDDGVYELKSGRVWVNSMVDPNTINILLDRLVLIPKNAIFDVDFHDGRVFLNVYDGDVYVGFLPEDIDYTKKADQYDELFLQTMLVPRGSSVTIPMSKVDSRIEKLLYLKLGKEFKYSAVDLSESSSDWAKFNLNQDKKYFEKIKQNVISNIIDRGEFSTNGVLVSFLRDSLTFFPEKRLGNSTFDTFATLNNAIYSRTVSDTVKTPLSNFAISDDYFNELFVFAPDSYQYEVYRELLKERFVNGDKIQVVENFWRDVYRGMNISNVKGMEAFDNYYQYLSQMFGTDDEKYKIFIAYQNQLMDNLFLRYSLFYGDKYFDAKHSLEQEMLRLENDFDQKKELRQSFVSNKIDFLKRLMKFFFEEKFSVNEAKEMLSKLVSEVNDLMPDGDSNVAVIEIFESQLDDIGDFWGYLSSPEYHVSKTYGKNHKERYASYLNDKDRVWSFINIQEDVLGNYKRGELSVMDVQAEVEKAFDSNKDLTEFEVIKVESADQRFIPVAGSIGGYPFQADYDRDKGWLKEVYAFGELVYEDSISLDSLLDLLKQKFATFEPAQIDEETPGETYAQRVARAYVLQKLERAGFVLKLENVSVVNELNAIYRVEKVMLKDKKDLELLFDFKMNGELASNVYLKSEGKGVVIEGEFELNDLYKMALSGNLAISKSGLPR
ncbi:hypothetical protein COU74_04010 [Candidatus Peregrinibacteria bacterium CG10_big_fil_rev_8_21_14_0_10_36_19]|nr:MAG: hypothetical protein COU74_04010 [Candidatus Peregrinibacteria bacterium CG10_big_fil_rev_8_21_14_0_10_36_19]